MFKAFGFCLEVFDLTKIALVDTRDVWHYERGTPRRTTLYVPLFTINGLRPNSRCWCFTCTHCL